MLEEDNFSAPQATAARVRRLVPLAAAGLLLVLAYLLGLHRYLSLDAFLESRQTLNGFVENNRALSAMGFVAGYALAVAVSFPAASLLSVAGGFLFGWLLGGALVVVGATIGATLIFLAARYAFGDLLRTRSKGAVGRFAAGFRRDAFSYLLLLRLTPVLPFFAVNIAPAFFDIGLRTYVITTFLGIIPGAFIYASLGSGLDQSLQELGAGKPKLADLVTPEMSFALLGLAALALLGFILKKLFLRPDRRPEPRDAERP